MKNITKKRLYELKEKLAWLCFLIEDNSRFSLADEVESAKELLMLDVNKFEKDVLKFLKEKNYNEIDIHTLTEYNGDVFFNMNDVFGWGFSDCEQVTPDNFPILKRAFIDIDDSPIDAVLLFVCRVRKMRPQNALYKHIDKKYWDIIDACGPEREIDFANPKKRETL